VAIRSKFAGMTANNRALYKISVCTEKYPGIPTNQTKQINEMRKLAALNFNQIQG